jgi:hypothetical protein
MICPSTDRIRNYAKGRCHSKGNDPPTTLTSYPLTIMGTSDVSSPLLLFLFLFFTDTLTHSATGQACMTRFLCPSVCPSSWQTVSSLSLSLQILPTYMPIRSSKASFPSILPWRLNFEWQHWGPTYWHILVTKHMWILWVFLFIKSHMNEVLISSHRLPDACLVLYVGPPSNR